MGGWALAIVAVVLYSKPDKGGKAWWKGERTGGSEPPSRPRNGCPICGSPMTERTRRDGRKFRGCTRYPACRGSGGYRSF